MWFITNEPTHTQPAPFSLWLLAMASPLQARNGLPIEQSDTHYSGATYRELVQDLRVKVAGGDVNVRRHWRQGRWWFNPQWTNLQFTYADYNISDDLPSKITRYDLDYTRVNGASRVYAYLNKLTITRTATGWRWADRHLRRKAGSSLLTVLDSGFRRNDTNRLKSGPPWSR